jgi:inner membrane protein
LDNLCHTLVGAALAEAGLKRRTALGTATLMIGANFPDIDAAVAFTEHGLGFRRGMTHGVPALIVLPFVLTGLMLLWDRGRRRSARRRGPEAEDQPADVHGSRSTRHRSRGTRHAAAGRPAPGQLLLLSAVSIATHPVLDWMNTYGMRWLMPFSGRWWYGDALFIVDPWVLTMLGVGIYLSRRHGRAVHDAGSLSDDRVPRAARPARVALAAVAAYVAAMLGLTAMARHVVRQEVRQAAGSAWTGHLMVEPVPANPVARRVVVERGGRYEVGDYRWLSRPHRAVPEYAVAIDSSNPLARRAVATPAGAEFMSWSRLPFFLFERRADSTIVTIADARYTRGGRGSWASVRVALPAP